MYKPLFQYIAKYKALANYWKLTLLPLRILNRLSASIKNIYNDATLLLL